MVEHHVWLVGEMLSRAERLPAGRLEARVEISVEGIDRKPTLRSLLARLVGQLAMWDAATHDRPYDAGVERAESITRLRAKLAEVGPGSSLMSARSPMRGGSTRPSSTPSATRRRSSRTVA